MSDGWTELDPAVSGHQMTHVIEIWEDGAPMDLTDRAVYARAKTDAGTAYAPTVTIVSQVDAQRGRIQVLHSAAQLATAGARYRFRVYIGATAAALSASEPLKRRKYQFAVEDSSETE